MSVRVRDWLEKFHYDPVAPLLQEGDEAVRLSTKRDLLEQSCPVEPLWELPEPRKILRRQQRDGSWIYPGGNKNIRASENYNQIETYRNLGILVEEFGFNRNHPAMQKAATYLFQFQTTEGDIRGIYGNQYTPNYTAGIIELLIKAGYGDDPRIDRVFAWLIDIRQQDGGWAIPLRTRNQNLDAILSGKETLEPDKTRPFSHMVTGVVLRAFAASRRYRQSKEAQKAGELLLSNLFKKDHYSDRSGPDYWLRFSFPFWFTDLISAMDSLSQLDFSQTEPQINKALQWFTENQQKNGLWDLKILKGHNREIIKLWLALSICRIFKRSYG